MAVWVWIIFTLLAHEAMSSENKRSNFNLDPSLNPVAQMLDIQPIKHLAEKFQGSSSFEVFNLILRMSCNSETFYNLVSGLGEWSTRPPGGR